MASDADKKVIKSYDAAMMIMPDYANRVSYVITPDHSIIYNYQSLNPSKHVENTLAALPRLGEDAEEMSVPVQAAATIGRVTTASKPGVALRSSSVPPWAWATRRHRYRPRPTPPVARRRAESGR